MKGNFHFHRFIIMCIFTISFSINCYNKFIILGLDKTINIISDCSAENEGK